MVWAFQPVADFDTDRSVFGKDEQHDPVVVAFLPDAPGFGGALGEIFQRRPFRDFRHHGDHDLVRCFALELLQFSREGFFAGFAEDRACVVDVAGRLWGAGGRFWPCRYGKGRQ